MNGKFHVDVSILQFLIGTAIPFVTAVVTQRFADERVKSAVTVVLAFVVAMVQIGIEHNGDFDVPTIIGQFFTLLIAAYFSHQFVWKPAHLTGDHGIIAKNLPSGVGRPVYGNPNAPGGGVTPGS